MPLDEWIKKKWCIRTMEYHPAMKKRKTLQYAETWMKLENIRQNERKQSPKHKHGIMPRI